MIDAGIADGSIDTVVIGFSDMHGRPVGKRVTADYFSSHAAEHGIEVCEYVLAVDVDMTPLPGYRFANWDTGYGDVVCHPDFATARRIPWLPGTAMVIADVTDADGVPVDVSPRQVLRRQLERAAERGLRVCSATQLEFFLFRDSYEEASEKEWKGLTPHTSTIEDYQLLQTAREEYILRRIRNEMLEAGIPVEFSKGEAGTRPARGQRHLRRGARDGGPPSGVQERHQGDRRAGRPGGHVHGQVDDGRRRLVVPRPHQPVGRGEWRPAHGRRVAPQWALHRRAPLPGRTAARRPRAGLVRRPDAELVPALRAGELGADGGRVGEDNRTCGFRVVGHGAARRVESRIPGADVNPYLVLAAAIAAGIYGIDHELELADPYPTNVYEATDVPRIPSTLVEAIDALRTSAVALEAFGPEVHHHLLNTAQQEWEASNRHVSDWELARYFERI